MRVTVRVTGPVARQTKSISPRTLAKTWRARCMKFDQVSIVNQFMATTWFPALATKLGRDIRDRFKNGSWLVRKARHLGAGGDTGKDKDRV